MRRRPQAFFDRKHTDTHTHNRQDTQTHTPPDNRTPRLPPPLPPFPLLVRWLLWERTDVAKYCTVLCCKRVGPGHVLGLCTVFPLLVEAVPL